MAEQVRRTAEIVSRETEIDIKELEKIARQECADGILSDFAFVYHNMDVDKDGNSVSPHYHFLLKYKNPTKYSSISNKYGVPENFISKIKSDSDGKGKWDGALAYLCHVNAPEKYQYDPSSVVASFDYVSKLQDIVSKMSGKGAKNQDQKELEEFLLKIDNEEFSRSDWMLRPEISKDLKRLKNWRSFVESAFDRVDSRYAANFQSDFDHLRNDFGLNGKKVIYLTGPGGIGKTQLAKSYCEKTLGVSCHVITSASDPLSEYRGEPAVVLDDFRPHSVSYVHYLALLDPHNLSAYITSRYKNKQMPALVVFLTSALSFNQFELSLRESYPQEDPRQIIRRFSELWRIFADSSSPSGYSVEVSLPSGFKFSPAAVWPYPASLLSERKPMPHFPAPNF